jgi:hypothetical protein
LIKFTPGYNLSIDLTKAKKPQVSESKHLAKGKKERKEKEAFSLPGGSSTNSSLQTKPRSYSIAIVGGGMCTLHRLSSLGPQLCISGRSSIKAGMQDSLVREEL